jgi:hypothetical protein
MMKGKKIRRTGREDGRGNKNIQKEIKIEYK